MFKVLPEQVGFLASVAPRLFNSNNFCLSALFELSHDSMQSAYDSVQQVLLSHRALQSRFTEGSFRPSYDNEVPVDCCDVSGLDVAFRNSFLEDLASQLAATISMDRITCRAAVVQFGSRDFKVVLVAHHLVCDQRSFQLLRRELTSARPRSAADQYEDAIQATWQALELPEFSAAIGRWSRYKDQVGPAHLYAPKSKVIRVERMLTIELNIEYRHMVEYLRSRKEQYASVVGKAVAVEWGSPVVAETVHNGRVVTVGKQAIFVQGDAHLANTIGMFATTGFRMFPNQSKVDPVSSNLDALAAGIYERRELLLGRASFKSASFWFNQVDSPHLSVRDLPVRTAQTRIPTGESGMGLRRDFADAGAGCAILLRTCSDGVRVEISASDRFQSHERTESIASRIQESFA